MEQESVQSTTSFNNFKGRNEYLLVIRPDEEIYNKVTAEKQSFYNQYLQKVSLKSELHITVASFMAREEMEETLIRWIQRISKEHGSFPVTLNNYSGFPPHTIYLRVQNARPFKQLVAQLQVIDQYVRSNGYPPVKFITHPHLSIARKLSHEVYEKAMPDYSQKTFFESFAASDLILLRRSDQYDTYRVVNVFYLPPDINNLFN